MPLLIFCGDRFWQSALKAIEFYNDLGDAIAQAL
jgi:hypothetical protein